MGPESRSCKEHKPRYKGALPNCATCRRYNWKTGKCREMIWVKEWIKDEYEDTREIERLMMHDAFRRSSGGIRQIRRGS